MLTATKFDPIKRNQCRGAVLRDFVPRESLLWDCVGTWVTDPKSLKVILRVVRKPELFEKDEEYVEALKAHHAALQAAMKTKQVVDVAACDALDTAIETVAPMYLKTA